MNRPAAITYPEDLGVTEVITNTYNNQALLSRVSTSLGGDYLSSVNYNALGQPKRMTFGSSGATTEYTYYGDGGPSSPTSFRLYEINSYGTGVTYQKSAYKYDNVGNITRILDHIDDSDGTETQVYGYDTLDRLLSASGNTHGTSSYSQSFAYSSIGNIASMVTNGITNTYAHSTTKPHAVRSISGGQSSSYTYDPNGNMTSGGGRTIAWDAENRPSRIVMNGITTTFTYDGDGKRIKKSETNGSAITTTVYVGNYYEKTTTAAGDTITKYYYAGGKPIAMRRNGSLSFLFSNHLGGTSVVLDATSGVTNTITFYPFGSTRTGSVPTDYRFTGQKADDSTGLYYYSNSKGYGRFYDSQLGRWTQPDTLVQNLADPQLLNRYTYARNNPVRHNDPDGHILPLIIGGIFVGALVVSYLATAPGVGAPAPGQEGRMPDTAAQLAEQDRAVLGANGSDFTNGNWGTVAVGAFNYVPGGRYLKEARELIPGIKALAESRALQGSVARLTSALERGAPGRYSRHTGHRITRPTWLGWNTVRCSTERSAISISS